MIVKAPSVLRRELEIRSKRAHFISDQINKGNNIRINLGVFLNFKGKTTNLQADNHWGRRKKVVFK
jgi:transcription antitermination factor NusG